VNAKLYLKKIDIQGFKSFADKTEIEFQGDISAIVGPNGSGKSNISDSIRWVLGEQSVKSLRGIKMEDVIFSGTDNRRPLGFAEVTIVFDNKCGTLPIDYNEVAVTRRMFRSGESEYYINKNSCRLKDIRDLFTDTGIGKDGYSIIGQGKIDEILSNKSDGKRQIFEEAAGIVKYKNKKEEAQRRLGKTESNIVRINDLIVEIERQHNSLEKEAEKARTFKLHYSKLKDLEVNLLLKDIKKIQSQIIEINIEKENILRNIDELSSEKEEIEVQSNLLKSKLEDIEQEIESTRTIKFDTIQSHEKKKNETRVLMERKSYLVKDKNRISMEISSLEERVVEIDTYINKQNDEILDNQKKLIELKTNLNEINKENEEYNNTHNNEEMQLDDEKNRLMETYNTLVENKGNLKTIESFCNNVYDRIKKVNNQIECLKIEKKKLDDDSLERIHKVTNFKNSLRDERIIYEDLKKKINVNEKEVVTLNYNINNLQIEFNTLNSKYSILNNMEEDYDGYYKSVKSLLLDTKKNQDLSKGLIGVVADLFNLNERYERAINISLGSSIQNIVVENEQDAKKFINHLKEKKLGRATFLPIDVIKGKPLTLNSSDLKTYNILGLAKDLISYDMKFENLFLYLLGRTIIIENLDSAVKFTNKYKHVYKVVTIDGDLLSPGGSLTGGSLGKDSIGIINRKNKISKLHDEIVAIKNELEKLEIQKQDLDLIIVNLNSNLSNSELKIISIEDILRENNNELNILNKDVSRTNDNIQSGIDEKKNLITESQKLIKDKDELIKRIENMESIFDRMKTKISISSGSISEKKEIQNSLQNKLIDIKIQINSLENTINGMNNAIVRQSTEKDNILSSINQKYQLAENHNKDLNNIDTMLNDIESKLNNSELEENDISTKLTELVRNKDYIKKEYFSKITTLKILDKKITDIERNSNSQDLRLAKYEVRVENNVDRLKNEYEMVVEEANKFEKPIGNMSQVLDEVNNLKNNIRELGNVNPHAMEEFQKINERLEFTAKQHDDLLKAKEDLNEVIREMNKKMTLKFTESFDEINNNFSEIFRVLFNGGKAELFLEEGDILEANIDIKAQPPGKKLQSLSLLSGGEKSLTAIALLFAIQKTKPVPFCILDEIDAALDDANINRYIKYLQNMNNDTQYILITHRKLTMGIANILYGVTMEEEGISKIISVKLKNTEEAS